MFAVSASVTFSMLFYLKKLRISILVNLPSFFLLILWKAELGSKLIN